MPCADAVLSVTFRNRVGDRIPAILFSKAHFIYLRLATENVCAPTRFSSTAVLALLQCLPSIPDVELEQWAQRNGAEIPSTLGSLHQYQRNTEDVPQLRP